MTTIKMLRDDEGVLSLIRQNTADFSLDEVDVVRPYPKTNAMASKKLATDEETRSLQRHFKSRTHSHRKIDRRQRQRRQHKRAVLLDTRSNHQRRTHLRRSDDMTIHKPPNDKEAKEYKPKDSPDIGIDTLI